MKPHRTDFAPNQSSLAQVLKLISKKIKNLKSKLHTKLSLDKSKPQKMQIVYRLMSVTVPGLSVSVTGLSIAVSSLSDLVYSLSVTIFPDSRTQSVKVIDWLVTLPARAVTHHIQFGSPYLGQAGYLLLTGLFD